MATVTVDKQYRVSIPGEPRERVKPGDALTVAVEETDSGPVVRYAKAVNPFDVLAEAALKEDRRGETVELEEFLRPQGVDPYALRAARYRSAAADSGVRRER